MNKNFLNDISEIQNEFMRRIEYHNPPHRNEIPSLLFKLIDSDEDLIEFTLGNIGKKLQSFANKVDFNHPDIATIFDGIIANDQNFSQQCCELIVLGKFAKEQNLSKIIPHFGNLLIEQSLNKSLLKRIDVPSNNRMNVRYIKDSKEREEIRMCKKMQIIDLLSVYKKGEDAWNLQPDNFKKFLRFGSAYEDDLKIARNKVDRYEELGCKSLAEEIKKSIRIFEENLEQSYYGFNRITMTNAAIILAKSLNFTYVKMVDPYNYMQQETFTIQVSSKFFAGYNFESNKFYEIKQHSEYDSTLNLSPREFNYKYEPRIYPLHEFEKIIPQTVQETIHLLENFPDADMKPIFDHFGVLVPSIFYPADKQINYNFYDDCGILHSYQSREQALKVFDTILIKNKYLPAILLGEKDGKCYFISYFA